VLSLKQLDFLLETLEKLSVRNMVNQVLVNLTNSLNVNSYRDTKGSFGSLFFCLESCSNYVRPKWFYVPC
jgi:hypothetical protein